MKPTNGKSKGCDPTSSNCVIWQGPDIECIELCNGDVITDVVYKMALELCKIMDTLGITNYDMTCFGLGKTEPEDFKELIQLLITKVCEIEGVPVDGPQGDVVGGGCPDCDVTVSSCFYFENPQGDTETTMQLKDYVIAIGNKVCSLVSQITTINSTLSQLATRITGLENAPAPTFTLPEIIPICVLPNTAAVSMEVLLAAVEESFCNLQNATGTPQDILLALQAACAGINDSDQLNGTGLMKDISGWHDAPNNLSQSFSNLWKVICDVRGAVTFIQNNCCDTGCQAIDLDVTGTVTDIDTLSLIFDGSVPDNYVDGVVGSTVVIIDVAGGGPQTLNGIQIKSDHFETSTPLEIELTGVNGAINLVVKITYRFIDPTTGSTCENVTQLLVLGANACPDLNIIPDYTNVDYNFAWPGATPEVVTIELWNDAESILLQSTALNIIDSNPSGNFANLTEGTTYKIRIVIAGTPCEFESFTALEYPCIAATLNAPTIDYSSPIGEQTGSTIEDWLEDYNTSHP